MNFEKMFGQPPAVKSAESIHEVLDPVEFGVEIGATITLTKIESSGEFGESYTGVMTRDLVPDKPLYLKQGNNETGTSAVSAFYRDGGEVFIQTDNSIYKITVDSAPVIHEARKQSDSEDGVAEVPKAQLINPDSK